MAKKAYSKGAREYGQANYNDALALFVRAFEELPDPAFLYNIAQCQRLLKKYPEAVRSYQRYLQVGEPDERRREQVEKIIAEVQLQEAVTRDTAPPSPSPPTPLQAPRGFAAPQDDAPAYKSKLAWGLLGPGVALTIAGVVLLAHSIDLQGRPYGSLQERKDFTDAAGSYQAGGWAAVGVGAAGIVGGAIVFGIAHHRRRAGHVEVARE